MAPDNPHIPDDIIEEFKNYFNYISDMGCSGFNCSETHLAILSSWEHAPSGTNETLDDIRDDLGDCRRCGLCRNRKHIVFGEGDPHARLVFVGEGPGFEEDKQGRPFVGPAGKLLTKIIAAINMTRESVYICNIVKCRPPDNRNPAPDEAAACQPFLTRQLNAIQPEFICALGSIAARNLLDTIKPVSMLRKRFHDHAGSRLLVTYHPAYLLRHPEKKRDVWEDMKMLMKAMGRQK